MQPQRLSQLIKVIVLAGVVILLPGPRSEAGDDRHEHGREGESHHRSSSHEQPSGNPLLEEMIILDEAFREVVSAVSLGDGVRVHRALKPLHGTMEMTHEGVHHGTVRLRKNADRLEDFVSRDRSFHEDLEKLAASAERNDRQAMLSITQRLLEGCVGCHGMYRP